MGKSKRSAALAMVAVGLGSTLTMVASPASAAGTATVDTSAAFAAALNDATTDRIVLSDDITLAVQPDRPAGADDLTVDGDGFTLTAAPHSWAIGTSVPTSDLSIVNLEITGATHSAIHWKGGSVNIADSLIDSNSSAEPGGGVSAESARTFEVSNTVFADNDSDRQGGALFTTGELAVASSYFESNTSALTSGAIEAPEQSVTMTDSVFVGNEATDGGGAVSAVHVDVSNSSFLGNSGGTGAIVGAETLMVDHSSFVANSGIAGGALSSPTITVVNSTLAANDADRGGATFSTDLTLVYSTIASNSAAEGASLDSGGSGELTSFGSVVTDSDGGANCSGFIRTTSRGYNVEGQQDTCGLHGTGDLASVADTKLADPDATDSGSVFLTPLPGSVLLDAIPTSACQSGATMRITDDQIGTVRPTGRGCDIGAVEADPRQTPPAPTKTPITAPAMTAPVPAKIAARTRAIARAQPAAAVAGTASFTG